MIIIETKSGSDLMHNKFFEYSSFPSLIMTPINKDNVPTIITVNSAFESITGYSSDELIGRVPVIFEEFEYSDLLTKKTIDGEKCCYRKDGESFWIHYSIFPIKDESNTIDYYGLVFFDITEKKALDKKNILLNDQFLNLVQNIPSTIYRCALDEHWTTEFLSDHIYDLSGYPLSDFIDNSVRSYASIIHPDDVEMVNRVVQEAVAAKEPYSIEYRIIHADGNIRYVYERGQATFNDREVSHLDGVITDITERKFYEKEIAQLAFYDPLTRLPNRRLLIDRLYQVQLICERNNRLGAVMFLDLDSFKELNDTFGHDYGDILLQQVANRLSSVIRKEDTVARLGGDEFIIVLKDLSDSVNEAMQEINNITEKIMTILNAPYLLNTIEYRNTPSIGITFIHGTQYDQDELIKQADQAMYDAKKSGRNTYRFFDR